MVINGAEFLGVASHSCSIAISELHFDPHQAVPTNSGTALQSMDCDLQDGDVETLMEMKLSPSSASREVDV